MIVALCACCGSTAGCSFPAAGGGREMSGPKNPHLQVEQANPPDLPGFTEGLEAHDGAIYESTGRSVRETPHHRIDRETAMSRRR